MLTPAKIKNHHFDASGRNGYKADGVDSFFEEVAASYEQMFQENGEMFKKLNLLAERLEEYKKDEDNIRNALLTAQRMAEKITTEAQEKADKLVAEVEERTQNEHARLDEQANAIIAEAQAQAAKIIDDATRESKEAAIAARSAMIKEEATLETMKAEVSKFKQSIVAQYAEQFELIEKLPEIVSQKIDEVQQEEAEEVAEEPVEEEIEEVEEAEDEPEAVAVVSDNVENADEEISVDALQQMIDDGEDTDAEDEAVEEEPEVVPSDDDVKFVLPEIDEASDEDLEKIVDKYEEKPSTTPDIMFTKPRRPQNEQESGFKVNVEKIGSVSGDTEGKFENYLDEFDDDEEDEDLNDVDGGFTNKLKGFFKK